MDLPDFLDSPAPKEFRLELSTPERRQLTPDQKRKQQLLSTAFTSAAFYLIAVALALFDSQVGRVNERAFGSHFGLSANVVSLIAFSLVYIPVPFIFWHLSNVLRNAMDEGMVVRGFGLFVHLFTLDDSDPSLRRSRGFILAGIVYVLVVGIAWSVYAKMMRVW